MRLAALILVLSLLAGCSMAEIRQVALGLSVDDVRNSKHKQVLNFDMSGPDCMVKIKDALIGMKAIVREDADKHFIYADNFQKAFRSTIDTTQVGIVVTWLKPNKCQVDIASHNIDLAIFVSKKLSEKLNPKTEVQETKK